MRPTQEQTERLRQLSLIGKHHQEQLDAATTEAANILGDEDYAVDLICNGSPLDEILEDLFE